MERLFKFYKCYNCSKQFWLEKEYYLHGLQCEKQGKNVHCYFYDSKPSEAERLDFEGKAVELRNEIEQMRVPWTIDHVKIRVARNEILEDSVNELAGLTENDMRKEFRLEFMKEVSNDAGGLTKEWLGLLIKAFFTEGLFVMASSKETSYVLPGRVEEDLLKKYYVFGMVIGKAIFEGIPVYCPLNKIIFKHIVDEKIKKKDLEAVDEDLFQGLMSLKNNNIQGVYIGNFVVSKKINGRSEDFELVPNGKSLEITEENKCDYIKKLINFELSLCISAAIEEIKLGLFTCIPSFSIRKLKSEELEKLLCGVSHIDIDEWKEFTRYTGIYSPNHPSILQFWKILEELPQESLKYLLQFATSYSVMPIEGFNNLKNNRGEVCHFTIAAAPYSPGSLPRGHTCFNRIDLPEYPDYEELEKSIRFISSHSFDFQIE